MSELRIVWDEEKNRSNRRKHGVSFEVAARVFADPFAVSEQDRFEGGEWRWQTLGMVDDSVLLLVAHTFYEEDEEGGVVEIVRIISARRATRQERHRYEEEG